jgi:two-component system response regulator HydG
MNGAVSRVLVVEDEHVLRLTFEEFLRQEGHEVLVASSYNEALHVLESHPVDVVVSDIILGGKTGIDLLREMHHRRLRAKFVTITGDPSLETATEAVRLGAFDYLPKPVNGTALQRVVRLALERKLVEDERDKYRDDLETIFNAVRSGIAMVDEELRLLRANPAGVRKLALPENFRGLCLGELHQQSLAPLRDALEHTIRTREPVLDLRIHFTPPEGDARIIVADTSALTGHGGAIVVVRDITRLVQLEAQVRRIGEQHRLVGRSAAMQEVYRFIEDVAETDSTVLIAGESGTGKELIAQAIHETSPRRHKPLVKVNCAALAEEVLESELFGHVRGAFTGAVKDRIGRFEAANGGTIFLDEIGDISPRLQMRLLRVLQEGEFERVGESRTIKVNVRVIAATNRDLPARIRDGEFRSDLYYRLNVIRIEVPPLRARREDLPALVDHFIRSFNQRMNKQIAGITPEAMAAIMQHSWPGNVRELENCLERAFVVCRESEIYPRHLPPEVLHAAPAVIAGGEGHAAPPPASAPWPAPVAPVPAPAPGGAATGREAVLRVLVETDWNIAKAARRLGISRNTLYQRIATYGINRPS